MSLPPPEIVEHIVALECDGRPGVARVAIEALSELTGIEVPAPKIEPQVRLLGSALIGNANNRWGCKGKPKDRA